MPRHQHPVLDVLTSLSIASSLVMTVPAPASMWSINVHAMKQTKKCACMSVWREIDLPHVSLNRKRWGG